MTASGTSRRDAISPRDAASAAVVLVFALFVPDPTGEGIALSADTLAIPFVVLACLALAVRNRWPIPVLAFSAACVAVVTADTTTHSPSQLAVLVALYTVAVRTDRRVALIAWVATAVALSLGGSVARHEGPLMLDLLSFLAWTGLATAIGDAVRNRRAYVAAVEERALRAEETLHEEARRQVAEERLRIARELHDVVAHHMAVVTVQAGVAGHLLRSNPDAAEEALGHVKLAGRTVLDELSSILTVLREPDDAGTSVVPAPGLGQLDELLTSLSAAGLVVDLSQRGQPQPLGTAVDLVAFRVLQEALTNAQKHGTGRATAVITHSPTTLSLCVTNPVTNPVGSGAAPSGGHGLIGMRERAAAVHGRLTAGVRADGQWQVEAELPLSRGSAA